jgi:hypothetical protein
MMRLFWLCCAVLALSAGAAEDDQKKADEKLLKQCASNLDQIGKACQMYADNPANGAYPKKLPDLFPQYIAQRGCLLCPLKGKAGAAAAEKSDPPACDFVYIPGISPIEPLKILAFCPGANHGGKAAVLVSGGSVQFMESAQFRTMLKAQLDEQNISYDLPKQNTRELTKEEKEKLKTAVRDLGSEDFLTREQASAVLTNAGETAKPHLVDGAKSKDTETAARCKNMLALLEIPEEQKQWIITVRKELGLADEKKDDDKK